MPARFSRGFASTETVTPPCGVNPTEEGSASPFVQVSLSLGDSPCDFVRMPWHSDSAVYCAFLACFRSSVRTRYGANSGRIPNALQLYGVATCQPPLTENGLSSTPFAAAIAHRRSGRFRLATSTRRSSFRPSSSDASRPFQAVRYAVLPEPKITNALQFLPAGADMGAGSPRRARRTWLPLDRHRDS